jgi:3-hydroxyisobutyrate dehydrogenase-like beta-hydroxyacid dehydrogenase
VKEPRVVAILSPGDMGGAIGRVLRVGGFDAVTCLEGRSELTRLRAKEAGIRDLPLDDLIAEADIVLSVLVPAEARSLAERVATSMGRTDTRPVYVDCNAIAPQTVREIEGIVRAAGAVFIDAGIIGSPPRPGDSTRFHCSGPDTSAFEALGRSGLDIRVVGPVIGQASGLKMVYAASTKGTTALWTELLVAARALGLEEALLAELGQDNATAGRQLRTIPTMPRRARRWIGEMEEIAKTFASLGLTPRMLEGAADMYRLVSATALGNQTSREPNPTLERVLTTLASQASASGAAEG